MGFERDEGMLPYSTRSFLGYRLLTEYFAFPQKFLFFDLAGLGRQVLQKAGNQLEVFFYLNRTSVDLEQNVTADTFQLGCTPIVNLYRQRAEPIALTHTETEYRVVPDARRPLAHEVYSIDRVTATSPENEQVEYQPFYSFKHAADQRQQKTFWQATRRPAGQPAKAGRPAEPRSTCRWSTWTSTPRSPRRLDARRGDDVPEPRPAPPAAVRRPGSRRFG